MVTSTLQVYLPYHGPAVWSTACCPQTLRVRQRPAEILALFLTSTWNWVFRCASIQGEQDYSFDIILIFWLCALTGCTVWLEWELEQEPTYWLNSRWVPIASLNPKFGFNLVKIKSQSLASTDLDLLFHLLSYRYINESCARESEQNLTSHSNLSGGMKQPLVPLYSNSCSCIHN